jgi:hypothetical protein
MIDVRSQRNLAFPSRSKVNTSQLIKTFFTTNHHSYRYRDNFIRFVMTLLNCKSVTGRIYIYFFHYTNVSPETVTIYHKHHDSYITPNVILNVNTDNRQHRTLRTDCITERVLPPDCHGLTAGSGPHAGNTVSRVSTGVVFPR